MGLNKQASVAKTFPLITEKRDFYEQGHFSQGLVLASSFVRKTHLLKRRNP
jgi:hypothetical protein